MANLAISCFQLDPIKDPRWTALVEKHPSASIFHTVGWLRALQRTYGYDPVVFTTSSPAFELRNGLVFCRVRSWITGSRLVSLPFSDHCEPLCDSVEELDFLMKYLQVSLEGQGWKYLQFRPINADLRHSEGGAKLQLGQKYFLHSLNLRPDLTKLFGGFDRDCVQRRVQRAERAALVEKRGRSGDLLKDFYRLFVATRGRHGLPPTPFVWFSNLAKCQADKLHVRVAYCGETPISAILLLRFKDVVYYKYGGSDARFNNLGATPWLLWRAIQEAKLSGAETFDLGRTDEDDAGLLAFKNHWVHEPKRLIYWNFNNVSSLENFDGWKLRAAKRVFSCMPDRVLTIAGRLLYRHIG